MRANVGLMLSHGAGETVMSKPDYRQSIFHHNCLLVLLRHVGPAKPRSLQKIFERVRRINNVKINDSGGASRDIWVRYVGEYPVENNDWGDFQTHRRLLGLVTIGKFENQTELNELCRQHESLKVRYSSTLYDSRAILFGPSETEGDTTSDSTTTTTTIGDSNEGSSSDCNNSIDESNAVNNIEGLNASMKEPTGVAKSKRNQRPLQEEYTTPSNFKARAFFYREHDTCEDLETHISEFIVDALFWVLESKRLDRSREKIEKVSFLSAPFEKKDFVGIDMESRNSRKRCVGRVTKNLADLSLQSGLVEESLGLYHSACETLRASGDSLWVGAAEEGLCAASAILLYPHLREAETLYRNASLQEGASPLRHAPDRWRASNLTTTVTPTKQPNSQNCDQATTNEDTTQCQLPSASSSCSSVSSILTNSTASGTSTPTTSSSTSTLSAAAHGHSYRGRELPGNILKPEEIPIMFRKAIINYSKYRHAAIIETESALKAARICIEQNRPLDVAMFLQNILYINVSMTEPERVKRFEIITELYQQIGYRRKAAFFQRLAALKHVQQGNLNPDWTQTYRLLLESFSGYLLSLDPLEVIENASGWPSLQIELLQGLITASRRLGHSALATRHMTFLLQTQWSNMSPSEQSEMAIQLQNLSAQCEGSPVPLVLENGTVIPPANLTDLPYCVDFVVKDLPAHLRPQRIKIVKADSGPFLFTPIHFSSIDRREKKKDKNKIAFFWVQNNLGEISVRLRNPLPFELVVSNMRLLTNGVVFESLPQTVTLQPHVPTTVSMHGTPIEAGQLEIQGYSTHTLGVKSNCRLKHMRERNFPPNFIVDVIPALPCVAVKTSLPQTATFSNLANADIVITSAALTLYNGETSTFAITIINESLLPVEHLEMAITSSVDQDVQRKIFSYDEGDLQSKLPLQPKDTLTFSVQVYGEADFVCPLVSQRASSVHSSGTTQTTVVGQPHSLSYSTISSSGHTSLPPRVGSPQQNQQFSTLPNANRRNDHNNGSFRSTNSGGTNGPATSMAPYGNQSLAALSSNATTSQYSQHIEAQFRIKYSGGEAMQEGYCRQCAISFNLELLPSAQITCWDVLPAEVPSQFYLVLDVSNLTAQEMSLNYTTNKSILIEARESCRVPIPVERCSLERICAIREAEYAENLEKELCFRTKLLSYSDTISKICSQHIAERVKINWLLTGTETHGVALLRGIVLTPAMIDLTTVSPLEWTIKFQNTPVQPQSEIVCIAGQSSALSITIHNNSQQTLRNLTLTVKFYQDYLNGMENYNLETRVVVSGANRTIIPLLEPFAQSQHECTVMFFTPGRFKTSIQCHSKSDPLALNQSTAKSNEVNAAEKQLRLGKDDQGTTNPQITYQNHMDSTMGYHESQQAQFHYDFQMQQQEHVWKFIPPIEVTVVEQQ